MSDKLQKLFTVQIVPRLLAIIVREEVVRQCSLHGAAAGHFSRLLPCGAAFIKARLDQNSYRAVGHELISMVV